jgi:hypothetical protein
MPAPRRVALALLAAVLLTVTGCTAVGPKPDAPSTSAAAAGTVAHGWTELSPPAKGARVMVFVHVGKRMLALGSRPGASGRAPAAWSTSDLRTWTPLAVHAVTGYGHVAELVMAASAGGRVFAYGQAFGGAHSNPRPTVWSGGIRSLTEHEQPFTMFGGEDALAVSAEAAHGSTALLAGSWLGASGRYGATVWLSASGGTWTRYADLPGLASEPGEQTSALAAAGRTGGYVLVGASAHYEQTGPPSTPLAWLSASGRSWERVGLPTAENSEATAVTCDGSACTIIGSTLAASQHLLCWSLSTAGRAVTATDGPGRGLVQVSDVALIADRTWIVADIDHVAKVFTVGTDCSGWTSVPLPVDVETAAIGAFGDRVVLATSGSGGSQLWERRTSG